MPGEPDEVLPQFDRMTSELMTALLPHLMKCLPDWPSVEGATPPSGSDRTSSPARPTA
jgi:hypothetical protein